MSEERLDRALERLLADRSPRGFTDSLSEDEQSMLQMAQLLRGSAAEGPTPQFVEEMHDRVFPSERRISRRTAFISGIGTLAAGLAAGVGIEHWATRSNPSHQPIVGSHGHWHPIAKLADVPEGTIHPFTAGAIRGFLIHRNNKLYSLSRICTHMGCALTANRQAGKLHCPCHGANFGLNGQLQRGPSGYPIQIPPLPAIRTRNNGEDVEVWIV